MFELQNPPRRQSIKEYCHSDVGRNGEALTEGNPIQVSYCITGEHSFEIPTYVGMTAPLMDCLWRARKLGSDLRRNDTKSHD